MGMTKLGDYYGVYWTMLVLVLNPHRLLPACPVSLSHVRGLMTSV